MLTVKTHFEQVPLETVKKIAEEAEVQKEKTTQKPQGAAKKKLKEDFGGQKHGHSEGENS